MQSSTLFHYRWAPPALALVDERGGARFVELQRQLGVGRESLRRALDALLELELVRRNPGYGHPLRPEYVVTDAGRHAARMCAAVLAAGDADLLLRKWSVPTLARLDGPRRFSELRSALDRRDGACARARAPRPRGRRPRRARGAADETALDAYRVTAAAERVRAALTSR